ncbi:MAG TPA: hypothetical protein PK109_01380 [Candidatus Paceibacterota bacterium]|nr:hypothetical protein [Candidatus Paceibacterota bacterium]
MTGFTASERALFKKLSTPAKIQDFLDSLPFNYEKKGETSYSPLMVIREKKAHCLEGALLAYAALHEAGEKPLLMNLRTLPMDDDHAVVLYRRNGYWGALSKTNHAVLRFRDPIYSSVRELAASYFHEYFMNASGLKTLRAYSKPMSLSRFGTTWIESEEPLWHIAHALRDAPHLPLVPEENRKYLRHASKIERDAGHIVEWQRHNGKT